MTHWLTDENRSHKKYKAKSNVMHKKQLKEHFGHKFPDMNPGVVTRDITVEYSDDSKYDVTLFGDKNHNLFDVTGLPQDDGNDLTMYTYETFMNECRGQNIYLI
jgi:hypothetical protein